MEDVRLEEVDLTRFLARSRVGFCRAVRELANQQGWGIAMHDAGHPGINNKQYHSTTTTTTSDSHIIYARLLRFTGKGVDGLCDGDVERITGYRGHYSHGKRVRSTGKSSVNA